MCEIEICYHSRAKKYLDKLNKNEKDKIEKLLYDRVKRFIENKDRRYVIQDSYFAKLGKYNSTIYYVKISNDNRAIISIDEDPIFEQIIINIFTICRENKLKVEIKGIMESLYQKMINEEAYGEDEKK